MTEISVRPMTHFDIAAAVAIAEAAYERQFFREDLELYLNLQSDGWMMAEHGDKAIGMGGITGYGAYSVIGIMATLPAYQRRGVASAIMKRLLDIANEWQCPLVGLDATEAGAPVYARMGFVEIDRTNVWELAVRPHSSSAHADGVTVAGTSSVDELVRFDSQVFGVPRRSLLRLLVEANHGRVLMVRDEMDDVSGYLIVQPRRLGPGAAAGQSAIEALVRAALSLAPGPGTQILMPAANIEGALTLKRLGFTSVRSTRHMLRGQLAGLGDRTRLLGLASFGLG